MAPPRTAHRPHARLHSLAVDAESITARMEVGDADHELAFGVSGVPLASGYDPFFVAALPIAMRSASRLSVPEPVSERLLGAMPAIQAILDAWWEELDVVDVRASPARPEAGADRGQACFFSGGVDSFHTVLRHAPVLDALIFVPEFEIGLVRDPGKRTRVIRALRSAAAELELPLIEVETNLRRSADRYLPWWQYAGTALASVAHLLRRRFHRVLLPASHSYRDLFPWGTSPLLDPRWSTDELEIVHEGITDRVEKVAAVARSDVAMRWLRVCHAEDAYNCGRCEKCLRTMVGLEIAGALERCETLPQRIPTRVLSRTPVFTQPTLCYARENLAAAVTRGADPALIRALRRMVRRGKWYLVMKPRRNGPWERIWSRASPLARGVRRLARALVGG